MEMEHQGHHDNQANHISSSQYEEYFRTAKKDMRFLVVVPMHFVE
jgi:hypothetical protein